VASIEDAAAFVDRVGIAVVIPQADLVLPGLWGALGDPRGFELSIRDADGNFVAWTEELGHAWGWKDELPERRLACVGRHLGRFVAVISRELVPAVWALRRQEEPDELQAAVVEAVRVEPTGTPQLRRLLGVEAKPLNRAVEALQRRCVLTSAGRVEQEQGWPSIRLDLFERRWRPAPTEPEEARRLLAARVLEVAGELSAADLAAALGWRRREAAGALAEIAEAHDEDGVAVFTKG
jgi:hypothetical protein